MRAAQQAELPAQPWQLPVSLSQRCAGPGLPSEPPPCPAAMQGLSERHCHIKFIWIHTDLLQCSQLCRGFSRALGPMKKPNKTLDY